MGHLLRLLDAIHQPDFIAQPDAVGICDDGGLANTSPMIRLALLRPTPGSASSLQRWWVLCSCIYPAVLAQAEISGLAAAQPTGLDDGFVSSGSAAANAATLGYF